MIKKLFFKLLRKNPPFHTVLEFDAALANALNAPVGCYKIELTAGVDLVPTVIYHCHKVCPGWDVVDVLKQAKFMPQ